MSILMEMFDLLGSCIIALVLVLIFAFIFDKDRTKSKLFWLIVFVFYLNAMYTIVGIPGIGHITWDPKVNLIPFQDMSRSNILGMKLNVIMLIPFGFFLPVYSRKFRKWPHTVVAGFFVSLTIELIQLFSFRVTDVDDLIMNTLGTLIGYIIARLVIRKPEIESPSVREWINLIVVNLIVIISIMLFRYPILNLF